MGTVQRGGSSARSTALRAGATHPITHDARSPRVEEPVNRPHELVAPVSNVLPTALSFPEGMDIDDAPWWDDPLVEFGSAYAHADDLLFDWYRRLRQALANKHPSVNEVTLSAPTIQATADLLWKILLFYAQTGSTQIEVEDPNVTVKVDSIHDLFLSEVASYSA